MIYLEIDILVRSPTPSHTGGRSVVVGGKGGSCLEPSYPFTGRLREVPDGKERKEWPPSILSEKGVEFQHKD